MGESRLYTLYETVEYIDQYTVENLARLRSPHNLGVESPYDANRPSKPLPFHQPQHDWQIRIV